MRCCAVLCVCGWVGGQLLCLWGCTGPVVAQWLEMLLPLPLLPLLVLASVHTLGGRWQTTTPHPRATQL